MWRNTNTALAALLIAGVSVAFTEVSAAKSAKSGQSAHRPMRSAPVYLERASAG